MSTEEFLPDALKDFIFDLHDSVRTSQIPVEQQNLYNGTFRELTSKVSLFVAIVANLFIAIAEIYFCSFNSFSNHMTHVTHISFCDLVF